MIKSYPAPMMMHRSRRLPPVHSEAKLDRTIIASCCVKVSLEDAMLLPQYFAINFLLLPFVTVVEPI
jgi:hypothetical protein